MAEKSPQYIGRYRIEVPANTEPPRVRRPRLPVLHPLSFGRTFLHGPYNPVAVPGIDGLLLPLLSVNPYARAFTNFVHLPDLALARECSEVCESLVEELEDAGLEVDGGPLTYDARVQLGEIGFFLSEEKEYWGVRVRGS